MLVEGDSEESEYTSNHVIIAGGELSYYLCSYFHLVGRSSYFYLYLYLSSYLYLLVPLGVLKKSHREMFVPSLSKGKKYFSCKIVDRILRKG